MKFIRVISILTALILSLSVEAQQVQGVKIFSASMDKEIPNIIVLPSDYATSDEEFPVVYLLHGAGGDFRQWMGLRPDLPEFADQLNIIIVCPDGGSTSWYFDSPVDPSMRYETYITDELVSYIDANYRTIEDDDARAITGLSMGGHGAFYLAFRHPDIFGAAGSTSGGLDIRPFPEGWDLPLRLGNPKEHKENWEDHTVINVLSESDNVDVELIFDCGTEDFFFGVNNAVHEKLLEMGIEHDYSFRPGGHDAQFWGESIPAHLRFFDEFFDENLGRD